jgi:hypothetical protein
METRFLALWSKGGGTGIGNVEVGLSEKRGGGAGARGHSCARSGKGFPPFFLLKPLSHATSAEDTPRPVEMSTITHVSIHYPRLPCAFPRP